jgi:heterotetrameric sarcosine oxidase delta subunit
MRIPCPFCGDRDVSEFVYRGDASAVRPSEDEGFYEYVYVRDNPAGALREHWYHAQGCRNWLAVERDTVSHQVFAAALARSGMS